MGTNYGVSAVLKWNFGPAREMISAMRSRSKGLHNAVRSSNSAFDGTYTSWIGKPGDAARNLSHMHYVDARATSHVIEDVAEQAEKNIANLEPIIAAIRRLTNEVKAETDYELTYDDAGVVYSLKSNAELLAKWGRVLGPIKLAAKEKREFELSRDFKRALTDLEATDRMGAENLNAEMEKLSNAVKVGATPMPSDPRLADIKKKYQVAAKPGLELFPPPTVRAALKALGVDWKQEVITSAEAQRLMELYSLRGAEGLATFLRIKSESVAAANSAFPGDVEKGKARDSGYADAFRHTYWNARMTQEFGADWTRRYASDHEAAGGNPPAREAMDLYNNEVGRQIGSQNPNASKEELAKAVRASISEGKTTVIDKHNELSWSNSTDAEYAQSDRPDKGPFRTGMPRSADIPLPAG